MTFSRRFVGGLQLTQTSHPGVPDRLLARTSSVSSTATPSKPLARFNAASDRRPPRSARASAPPADLTHVGAGLLGTASGHVMTGHSADEAMTTIIIRLTTTTTTTTCWLNHNYVTAYDMVNYEAVDGRDHVGGLNLTDCACCCCLFSA